MLQRKVVFIEITPAEIRFLWQNNRLWHKSSDLFFHHVSYDRPERRIGNSCDQKIYKPILVDFREKNFGRGKVDTYLYIPFQSGSIREFKLPWVEKKYRDSAIRYYIEHEFPVPAGELIYDDQVVEEKEKEFIRVRVSATRKDVIDTYADCFDQAGYALKGIDYAVNAAGEIFGSTSSKRILCLYGQEENRVQMVMYRHSFPEVIREFHGLHKEMSKYQIYLGLQEFELPVERILTDGTASAERIASLLQDLWFAGEKMDKIDLPGDLSLVIRSQGQRAYPLLGGFLRRQQRKEVNLYRSFLIPAKLKALAWIGCLFLAVLIILGSFVWYPAVAAYLQIDKEVNMLQEKLAAVQAQEATSILTQWQQNQRISLLHLEELQRGLSHTTEGMVLTRLNYKNLSLYIWAECEENMAIAILIGKLTADGWRDPVIANYKFQDEKITFNLTVKR